MQGGLVTVFGGSGFIGRQVVRALCRQGWRVRVAMRRPHLGGDLRMSGDVGQVQLVQANVRNRPSIQRALTGADAVVNVVGTAVQRGRSTFQGQNVLGPQNVAILAKAAGVSRLVYVSGLNSSPSSRSAAGRTKGEGEAAVRAAFPGATILRPSVVFGTDDTFFNKIAQMARLTPVLPLIGGATKIQPVFVGDVARAAAAAIAMPEAAGGTYELGGPRTYTMKELYDFTLEQIDRPRLLIPLPFMIAAPMGYVIGALSRFNPLFGPPITGDQVQLLRQDNVVGVGALGFAELGVSGLETIESVAPAYLWPHRPHGQFQTHAVDEVSRVDV
jgi:NADH dehydrogenase